MNEEYNSQKPAFKGLKLFFNRTDSFQRYGLETSSSIMCHMSENDRHKYMRSHLPITFVIQVMRSNFSNLYLLQVRFSSIWNHLSFIIVTLKLDMSVQYFKKQKEWILAS